MIPEFRVLQENNKLRRLIQWRKIQKKILFNKMNYIIYIILGQFILNFEKYVRNNKNEDLFYVDNNKLIDYLKDYKTENLN